MSKTYRHQDEYNWMHDRDRTIPTKRLFKLLNFFSRCNFWDPDEKIKYRKIKDFKRGGLARIKAKKYKPSGK